MLKREIHIMFTCIGRRVELVQAFRNAAEQLDNSLKIFGTDISDYAPALSFCDVPLSVCRIKDEGYIPGLLDICGKYEIDLLIPTIDTDLLLLAEHAGLFEQQGTKVLVSPPERIKICRDKRLTAEYFRELGLGTPYTTDVLEEYQGGYPCFIKPLDGSSSVDAYRAGTPEELAAYARHISNYIIQQYIEGEEYTVDIFCDYEGNPIYITPRQRLQVRGGEVVQTKIVMDEVIIAECRKLIEHYRPCGQITVQLIREAATGQDYYIEINPRFGGGAPLSMKAGADSAWAILKILQGEKLQYQENAAADGAVYSRFDQSICVDGAKRNE